MGKKKISRTKKNVSGRNWGAAKGTKDKSRQKKTE